MIKIQIFGFVLLAAVACTNKSDTSSTSDQTGPVIKLSSLDGNPIDMNQFKGKTLFINFWATWCRPCVAEMPSIARAMEQLHSNEIEFLFASNEEVDAINKFAQKRNLDLHYVLAENMEELKIEALPTTMILNSKGEIAFSEIGFRQWDEPSNLELITKIMNAK